MPEISQVNQLPLSVNSNSSGNVTLSFTDVSALTAYDAILKDAYLNTFTDIKTNPVYAFSINKSVAASYGNDRFKVLISAPTVLSVNLHDFLARKTNNGTRLTWTTASENNSNRFEIERSSDGADFITIGTVKAQDNTNNPSNYTYLDENPLSAINYYRLKQLNNDNKATYSKVIRLNYSLTDKGRITLYPNPATNQITVSNINSESGVTLSFINVEGQEIKRLKTTNNEAPVNISDLAGGLYSLLIINNATNTVIDKIKFVKQ